MDGFGGVGGLVPLGVLGHRHERRSDDTVAQPVAAAQLLDDLAAAAARSRNRGNRVVLARVEAGAWRGLDCAHAFALEELPKLAIDRRNALDPRLVRPRGRLRAMLDGEVE